MNTIDFTEDPGTKFIMELVRTINTSDEFKDYRDFVLSVRSLGEWKELMRNLFEGGVDTEPSDILFSDHEDHHRYLNFVSYSGKMFYIAENKKQRAEYILTTKPKTVIKYASKDDII